MGDVRKFKDYYKKKHEAVPAPAPQAPDKDYDWLYSSYPAIVILDGVHYPSVTYAFHASKLHDPDYRNAILNADCPATARTISSKVRPDPDWEYVKALVMEDLTRQKFVNDQKLTQVLLETGDSYIKLFDDGDPYWGVDPHTGRGLNALGHILMRIRADLAGRD